MRALTIFFAIFIMTGCVIIAPRHDNGKHKGWFKNTHNPHNPAHTSPKPGNPDPGHDNGKGKGKGKGK